MYLIRLARVLSSSLHCKYHIFVTDGPLYESSRALARLERYSMLMASACFLATYLPGYAGWSHVVISVSLTLGVTCEN